MNASERIDFFSDSGINELASASTEFDGSSFDSVPSFSLNLEMLKQEEEELLSAMGIAQRKRQGVFFTPDDLARLAVSKVRLPPGEGSVLDPACGTGNLLFEVASRLEPVGSLYDCLIDWNARIYGLDINSEFIDLARKKIVSLAISKGAIPTAGTTLAEAMSLLSNIRVGDFLVEWHLYKDVVQHVVMNPPFCPIDTPAQMKWTTGKSNAAASFMAHAVNILPVGGKVLGILPDVLKSGSRYEAWRREVFESINPDIENFGSFQKDVQIDVFILSGAKALKVDYPDLEVDDVESRSCLTVSDKFNVSVGPVVPHRDLLVGVETPFAHAKILPAWSTLETLPERISHPGRKISCPFIAIRRTSSPKDRYRVVGAIVNCDEPVAVENHIIVVSPIDGTIETCVSLLNFFKSAAVNDYINSRTRCRHLTVGVIKELPIGGMDEYAE